MSQMRNGVIGVGYEGQSIDAFVDGLSRWGVTRLFDVRLNPLSRKKGFSKRSLSTALADAGIAYVHVPSLGNPKDNRDGFAESDTAGTEGGAARERFRSLIDNEAASDALQSVTDSARGSLVAVMCFEASELHCHRREVLADVRARLELLVDA